MTRELQARSACQIGQSCEWRLFRNCAERTARSAPSGWRIALQVRIAERSGIPPVRTRRSGGSVQDRVRSQDPETGSGSKRTA